MKSGISGTCFSSHQNGGMGLLDQGVRRIHEGCAVARLRAEPVEANSAPECDTSDGASPGPDCGHKPSVVSQSDNQCRHAVRGTRAHTGHFSTDDDLHAERHIRHRNTTNDPLRRSFSLFPTEKCHFESYFVPISAVRIADSQSPLESTITSSWA